MAAPVPAWSRSWTHSILPTLTLTVLVVPPDVADTLTEIFLPFRAWVTLSFDLVAFLIFFEPANHWIL